jgi:hypothetical protein
VNTASAPWRQFEVCVIKHQKLKTEVAGEVYPDAILLWALNDKAVANMACFTRVPGIISG